MSSHNSPSTTGTALFEWRHQLGVVGAPTWIALAAITLLGAWLRWRHIDVTMRYDEAYTVTRYASRSLVVVLADYSLPNNHVFHTVLVYLAATIGGLGPEVVRLPAFAAGVMLIPTSFLVFTRLSGAGAGLLGAALVAGSSTLVDYSVNARGYTLAALLALVAVGIAADVRSGFDRSRPFILGIVGALGMWIVPVFLYAWAGVLLWVLAPTSVTPGLNRARACAVSGLVSITAGAVLYSPILIHEGIGAVVANRFVTPDPLDRFFAGLPVFFTDVASMWTHNVPAVIAGLLLGGFVYALASSAVAEVRLLAWAMSLAVLLLLFAQHVVPYPRNWLLLLPILLGIAASGIVQIVGRIMSIDERRDLPFAVGAILVFLTLFVSVWTSTGNLSGEDPGLVDAEKIVLDLAELASRGDRVVALSPSTAPLRYYMQLHEVPAGLGIDEELQGRIFIVTTGAQTVGEVLLDQGLSSTTGAELIVSYPSGELWRAVNPLPSPSAPSSRADWGC